MSVTRTSRPSFRGFSLVELLVVIAIIVALLAILLPSMNRGIELVQRTTCLSNQHQIHIAALTVAADRHGRFLPCRTNGESHVPLVLDASELSAYVKTYGVREENWSCPGREQTLDFGDLSQPSQIGYAYLAGITRWMSFTGGFFDSRSPVSIATARADWVMIVDRMHRMDGDWFGNVSGSEGVWGPSSHRLKENGEPVGGNHLFVDGSGRWIDFTDTRRLHTWWPGRRELFWAQRDVGGFYE